MMGFIKVSEKAQVAHASMNGGALDLDNDMKTRSLERFARNIYKTLYIKRDRQ